VSYLQISERKGYQVVALDRGRANALEQQLVDELRAFFRSTAEDPAVGGLVLSGKERFFSAGLDLVVLYEYNEEQLAHFWRSFMALMQEMAAWPKPLVAAVTGHAPAGGCLLALTADYRVMAEGEYIIGLNEIPVGITVPQAIFNLYRFWIGQERAYTMLLEGQVVKPREALQLGMVSELAPDAEVLERAEKQLRRYLGFHPQTWRNSKANLRRELLAGLEMDFEVVFGPALKLWFSPEVRTIVGVMVEGLKSKTPR
jgi:Delta3-Delta2-enoyl-CoA isomerase